MLVSYHHPSKVYTLSTRPMILFFLPILLHIATASPLLPPLPLSPLFPSFNTTLFPWHCNRAPTWTKRESSGRFQVMDCLRAVNAFQNDMIKSHDADYQWLALGASAVPGRGTPVFMPRRYISGMSSPLLSSSSCLPPSFLKYHNSPPPSPQEHAP